MLKNVQGDVETRTEEEVHKQNLQQAINKQSMKFLPAHLIVSYYTLRFINSKDAKTRILYNLNYFRSIQKRLALDLREFGTRERVDSHQSQPYLYPTEANKSIIN